jgi:hypothetical protein
MRAILWKDVKHHCIWDKNHRTKQVMTDSWGRLNTKGSAVFHGLFFHFLLKLDQFPSIFADWKSAESHRFWYDVLAVQNIAFVLPWLAGLLLPEDQWNRSELLRKEAVFEFSVIFLHTGAPRKLYIELMAFIDNN